MARPRKTGAEYFSHDHDARNNRKVKALMNRFGLEGYAVYFMTLETLCGLDKNRIEYGEEEAVLISGDFGIDPAQLMEIWSFCIRLKLFHLEPKVDEDLGPIEGVEMGHWLISDSLIERLIPLYEKREKDRKRRGYRSENPSYRSDNPTKKELSTPKTPQRKVKENKVKEIKENEEEEIDILESRRKVLIERLCKFNSERMSIWRSQAAKAGVDLDVLQLQFCNKIIQESGSEDRIPLIAGFDKYLLSTVTNKANGKERKGSQSFGRMASNSSGKGFVDTSRTKDEAQFYD